MPMYVMSNEYGFYGAGAILYPGVIKAFAASLGNDLIILLSSVHEMLLIPDDHPASYKDLADMVEHINVTDVPAEDRLSNRIYRYDRREDKIMLISDEGSADE